MPQPEAASIPHWRFDYPAMAGIGLVGGAAALGRYVDELRDRRGYDSPIDIVRHSFGACIACQCLEVADGAARKARIGRLIMLGPPNNGSALAELFSDPDRGLGVLDRLAGVSVPPRFDPLADPIVQMCGREIGQCGCSVPPDSGTTSLTR